MEKKGLCMCFNFQIAFWKECKGVTVFRARTSFLNTSYLFQSHYCNAIFTYIRNPLCIRGTGALDAGDTFEGVFNNCLPQISSKLVSKLPAFEVLKLVFEKYYTLNLGARTLLSRTLLNLNLLYGNLLNLRGHCHNFASSN